MVDAATEKSILEIDALWSGRNGTATLTVKAGGEEVAANCAREDGSVTSWPRVAGMILDGRQLPGGDFIVMDRAGWFGYRLGPDLGVVGRYPKVEGAWNSNVPVEAWVICSDSKGMVYAANNNSIYVYHADGTDGKVKSRNWESGKQR